MLPIIVGAAGHVDHGKTSLVRLLTDRDTDTLPEEKARGMSIDLSVVPLTLPDKSIVGLVDVPGHRDYIKNSVAGISSINLLLLVVAADDGVMPQTIEHVKAAHFFGASRAVVAINKSDLVDNQAISIVCSEVAELLNDFKFAPPELINTSCVNQSGVEEVRAALGKFVNELAAEVPADPRAFRMSVRKGFPVKGLGTVITGIPISGQLRVGAELELLPEGTKFSVKAAQHYREEVDVARAGISTAINTRDLVAGDIKRGTAVVEPGLYQAATQAYLSLNISSAKTELKPGARAMLHTGCASVSVQLRPLDTARVGDGQEAICFAKFAEPIVVAAGDRFILRSPNRGEIIGGGRVLAAGSIRTGKLTEELLDLLVSAKTAVEEEELPLAALLLSQQVILSAAGVSKLTHSRQPEVSRSLTALGKGEFYLLQRRFPEIVHAVTAFLKSYHQKNKLVWGARPELVAELLRIPVEVLRELIPLFAKESSGIELKHGRLALASFAPEISARDISLREKLLNDLTRREQRAIARGDAQKFLNCTEQELKRIISLLVDEGELKVIGIILLQASLYEECFGIVSELGADGKVIELGVFRDRTALSRNVAVAILDELDSRGVTFRVGTERKLRRSTTELRSRKKLL